MADVWDLAPVANSKSVWDLAPAHGGSPLTQRGAQDLGDAIIAGMQNSATGLAYRRKLPDQVLGEDAPWYHRLASGAGGVIADAPLSFAAAFGGGVAGTAVAPGAGTVIGAGAAGFAAPMALREALIEAYSNNHALSWEGAWEIGKAALKGGAKGAVIGGATMGAGRVVAPMVAKAGGGVVASSVAATGAELATLTATSAALEGHMPTWQDFMDNALLLGGLKTVVHTAGKMRNIFAETGKRPEEVLADAARDPKLKAELAEPAKPEVPEAYRSLALEQRIEAAIDADPRPEMIRRNLTNDGQPPKLGEPPISDPVKYEYITDLDTAKGVLRAVAGMYEAESLAQTRGEVSNKATAIESAKRIAGGEPGPHLIGEAASASGIHARAHVLKGATNHAAAELAKIAATPEIDLSPAAKLQALAAIERVAMLKAEFDGVAAEAGRALQIFRTIKRDPAFLGEAETVLKLAERKGNLQDIAAMAAAMKDPAQMARFAQEYTKATTFQKVVEAWRAGIFSGPLTWQANVYGNVAKWMVELPESTIAATIEAGGRIAAGDPMKMAQFKARAFAPLYGLQLAALDGIHLVGEWGRVAKQEGFAAGTKAARVDFSDFMRDGEVKLDVVQRANTGGVGKAVGFSFGALKLQDLPFRTIGERAEAYKIAVDRAVKEGEHPSTKEFNEAVARYTDRPTLGLSEKAANETTAKIEKAGAEAVFGQQLGPRLAQVSGAMSGTPWEFVFPARRTPVNLLDWAVQHTPGANLLSSRWREDFAAGGEQRARAIARVVIGTALAATAIEMAQSGALTGGGLTNKELSGTKEGAGYQNYSLKVGNEYYSVQRIEPVSKLLMITADLHEIMSSTKVEDDKTKAATLLALAFGNATVSTTYMSGLANLMKAVLDPDRYGGQFIEGYATSVVPKIVGQPVTIADPYKREVDGVMEAIQSQLPFLREKLLPKRSVWGEPVANGKWFDVMPIATSTESQEKVKTEALRLSVAIAAAPKYAQEKGPFNPSDKRIELKPEQRDIHREVSGKNAMAILSPIVNAPDWERIPEFAKGAIFRDVIEGARKQGMYAALPPDAVERQKLRDKIIQRIIKESQDVK